MLRSRENGGITTTRGLISQGVTFSEARQTGGSIPRDGSYIKDKTSPKSPVPLELRERVPSGGKQWTGRGSRGFWGSGHVLSPLPLMPSSSLPLPPGREAFPVSQGRCLLTLFNLLLQSHDIGENVLGLWAQTFDTPSLQVVLPQTGGGGLINSRHSSLTILQAGRPRSSCQHGQVPAKAFLAGRWQWT